MADMISAVAPTASIVTSFKSSAEIAPPPAARPTSDTDKDSFGPAVIMPRPQLSGADISAMKEVAATTPVSTPPTVAGYDASGQSVELGKASTK
tara:strand:+ start:32874 stop:33155 length:282 start_codon:yes stop_codon:yes gene_type:complete